MNKNKMIFAIIGIVLIVFFVFLILSFKSSTNSKLNNKNKGKTFIIWTIGDDKNDFLNFLETFKKIKPKYKDISINIENFTNYEEYYLALTSAITKGKTPDIFVLNNSEKQSIFSEQTMLIDPKIINPNDFRKKYKGVFSDDLIINNSDSQGKQKEFLTGIPVGYESLGIFYNRRYIKSTDLNSLSSLNNIISKLKNRYSNLIPIGIGNGTTVYGVSDIITQFFMLESGVNGLKDVSGNKLKQSLATYLLFGDLNGENKYNSKFVELKTLGQNNLDLFSKGETFMTVGYPRMIKKIDKNGFSKSFLRAEPFPHYYSGEGKTLINYNYFVINKNVSNYSLATDLLLYLSTDSGASNYLSKFSYYLPALLSLESDKLGEKINPDYNIILENFYNRDYELSSFDRGIKNIYDRNIIEILDNSSNYENAFANFRNKIICKTKKITSLENLSNECD